jgi:hypothetical protein
MSYASSNAARNTQIVGGTVTAEITDRLQKRLAVAAAGERLDVILELREPEPSPGSVEASIREFRLLADRVSASVATCGGRITAEAWINFTLGCDAPVESLQTLATTPGIARIDLPAPVGGET